MAKAALAADVAAGGEGLQMALDVGVIGPHVALEGIGASGRTLEPFHDGQAPGMRQAVGQRRDHGVLGGTLDGQRGAQGFQKRMEF